MPTDELRVDRDGRLGQLVLDRPAALNAITPPMVRGVHEALDTWEPDATLTTVLVTGAGDRGLSAGGDVRGIHRMLATGRRDEALAFWADEYRMNARIGATRPDWVAVMDGLCLGGGVGIAAHGSHRVATDRSIIGMPEVRIGFCPDVGASWLYSRLPDHLGLHLALTAGTVDGADAVRLGLADVLVPHDRLDRLAAGLREAPADEVLAELAVPVPAPDEDSVLADAPWVRQAHAAGTVTDVLAALRDLGTERAAAAADAMAAQSPTALVTTLAMLRRAATLPSLAACLDLEYRMAHAMSAQPDFVEGVRARLVDKDRAPRWAPPTLDEVDPDLVATWLDPGDHELGLSAAS